MECLLLTSVERPYVRELKGIHLESSGLQTLRARQYAQSGDSWREGANFRELENERLATLFPGTSMAPQGPEDALETPIVNSGVRYTGYPLCKTCLGSWFPKMCPVDGKIVSKMLLLYEHKVTYLWGLHGNPLPVTGPHWSMVISQKLIQK